MALLPFDNTEVNVAAMICKDCGSAGDPARVTKGSTMIELILWLCFIVPGLIYSFWRLSSRYDACGACGSTGLVPLHSPVGKKLAQEFPEEIVRSEARSSGAQNAGAALGRFVRKTLLRK